MIFNINKKYTLKNLKSLFYLACVSVVMLTLLITKSGDNIRDTELIVSKLADLTKIPNTVTSVILGTILGPVFYLISPEWCILYGGVTAGIIAFFAGEFND